jgi:6-phosphogluconolactonase
MADQDTAETLVYIGTYTDDKSAGIHIYRLDPSSGALEFVDESRDLDNAFFLTIDADQRYLYATANVEEPDGQSRGAVSAFSIDPQSGGLTHLNQQPTQGIMPCHLSIDQTGKHLLVANYTSGSVAVLPIEEDGRLGPATDLVQHTGSSVHPERQDGPYVHSITPDPSGHFAVAADLGIDKVLIYRFDAQKGKLMPNDPPGVEVQAGAGPRHFAFNPNGGFAYVINELDNTIAAFAYDGTTGALSEIQTVPTLPTDFAGESYCADVQIHRSGRFLYGSNRGHDSIAIFAVDGATGRLTFAGREPSLGHYPYNLALDPSHTFLLTANHGGDCVVVFRIDQDSGRLTSTGHSVTMPNPVCIKMTHRP